MTEASKLNVCKKKTAAYFAFLLLLASTATSFATMYPTLEGMDLGWIATYCSGSFNGGEGEPKILREPVTGN